MKRAIVVPGGDVDGWKWNIEESKDGAEWSVVQSSEGVAHLPNTPPEEMREFITKNLKQAGWGDVDVIVPAVQ